MQHPSQILEFAIPAYQPARGIILGIGVGTGSPLSYYTVPVLYFCDSIIINPPFFEILLYGIPTYRTRARLYERIVCTVRVCHFSHRDTP